jgi:hypothetical protein
MKRVVTMIVLGIGGLVAATAMTVGALALAGNDLGDVVHPRLDQTTDGPSHTPSSDDHGSSTASPSVDDHGGRSSGASPSIDDHGGGTGSSPGGSDGSGHGSGSGGSGPGSSGSSGSGSSGSSGHSGDDD